MARSPPLDLDGLPSGSTAVGVAVIDTTAYLENLAPRLVVDPVYAGFQSIKMPSYSFLITHAASGARILFDLGLRSNWATHLSPHLLEIILQLPFDIVCEKDTADILAENGVQPQQIDAIVYSHHHWDHVGDPTKFPSSTKIVVGPGYKAKYLPGWPLDADAVETTSDLYHGRETVEVDFTGPGSLVIGQYQAYDYFGDGSFYLLSSPGHTTGHLAALARTTTAAATGDPDTFILLAADTVHHPAVFRPTKYCPLPDRISPAPYPADTGSSCPGEWYAAIHRSCKEAPHLAYTTPFCITPPGNPYDEDHAEAERTIDKLLPFDGNPDVFTISSHDHTLLDVIDFFPKPANEWKAMQWKQKGHWRFLGQLDIDRS